MLRKKWKRKVRYSDEYKAREAYAVLIRKEQPSRSVTRAQLKESLSLPTIYRDFLKLCLEQDGLAGLEVPKTFKRGVYLVFRSMGLNRVEHEMGVSRVTLYRMFSPEGNPSLSHLMKVIRFLGLRLWMVDEDFLRRGERQRRLKDEKPESVIVERDPRIRLKRENRKGPKTWSYVEEK